MLPSLAAASLYAGASGYQGLQLLQHRTPDRRILVSLGLLALLAHSLSLFQQLLSPAGLHLELFNAFSLMTASIILLVLLALRSLPVDNLLLLLFPLGAVASLLAQFIPSGLAPPITEKPGILAHILLSLLAYGIFTIAALQALLLLVQNRRLKQRHPTGLTSSFPPLQTMESLLFGFIGAGWLLLCASLLSGWLFLDNMFAQHPVHKTLLSVMAWVVFGLLLAGRHYFGWRGLTAIRWTLAGFCLLMLAYFGSKLVREYILHI